MSKFDENNPNWRQHFQEFEKYFDSANLKDPFSFLPPDQKAIFENSPFGRLRRKFALSTVADASSLISILRGRLTGKTSAVWELVKSGWVKCWSPLQLERDLVGKFKNLAEELQLQETEVLNVWRSEIAPLVKIESADAPLEVQGQLEAIRQRDPNDVEYISLAITIGADGVFTNDKDIIEDGHVRVLKFGEALRLVSTYKRGRLATTIQFHCSTVALLTVGGITVGTIALAKMLFNLAKRVPAGLWIGLGVGLGIAMFFERPRQWMKEMLRRLKEWLKPIWTFVKEVAKELWRIWWPVMSASLRAVEEGVKLAADEPGLGSGVRRRYVSCAELETRAINILKASRKRTWRPRALLLQMFPNIAGCDLSAIRVRLYRLLRGHPQVQRVNRGLYRWSAARTVTQSMVTR